MNSITEIKTWAEELAALDATYRVKIENLNQALLKNICDMCSIPEDSLQIRFNEGSGVFCLFIKTALTSEQYTGLAALMAMTDEKILSETPFAITCAYSHRKQEEPQNDGT